MNPAFSRIEERRFSYGKTAFRSKYKTLLLLTKRLKSGFFS